MIDWNRLKELREEIGSEDFDEVVDLFLEEVEGAIAQLRNAPAECALEDVLHFLKGSALSLGFLDFSILCQSGETNAAQGNIALIDLPEILTCYEKSKTAFLEGLPHQLAA